MWFCDPRSRGFHDIFRLVPRRHIHILAYNAGVRMGKRERVGLFRINTYVCFLRTICEISMFY